MFRRSVSFSFGYCSAYRGDHIRFDGLKKLKILMIAIKHAIEIDY